MIALARLVIRNSWWVLAGEAALWLVLPGARTAMATAMLGVLWFWLVVPVLYGAFMLWRKVDMRLSWGMWE